MAASQEWRGALWRICHGSLSVRGGPRAEALRPEPLAHAWLHLRKSLDGLAAAAPAAMALPEAAALRDAAGRMDHALGLDAGPPMKPYLWRAGGHPVPPPTAALCEAAAQLAALADLTRPHTGPWVGHHKPDTNPSTGHIARLAAAGVELPGAALQLPNEGEGSPGDADARESAAEAALAALSADWSLRQALLEGLGFFALAVQRVRECGVAAGRGGDSEGRAAEGDALEVVGLLQARVQARVQEVRLHGTDGASVHNWHVCPTDALHRVRLHGTHPHIAVSQAACSTGAFRFWSVCNWVSTCQRGYSIQYAIRSRTVQDVPA